MLIIIISNLITYVFLILFAIQVLWVCKSKRVTHVFAKLFFKVISFVAWRHGVCVSYDITIKEIANEDIRQALFFFLLYYSYVGHKHFKKNYIYDHEQHRIR